MSIFKKLVPDHELTPFLLCALRWVPFDPEHKYPLRGRLDYVWMSEDYQTIKLLLRDSDESWSEQKQETMDQITKHESFISVEKHEADPTYLIAEFRPITDWSWVEEIDPKDDSFTIIGSAIGTKISKEIAEMSKRVIERLMDGDVPNTIDITTDPMVLFMKEVDLANELLDSGVETPAVAEIKEALKKTLEQPGNTKIFRI